MDPVIQHVQDNIVGYGVLAACVIPILVVFRKYTFPFLLHTAEIIAYSAVFHFVFGGIVRFFAWFKEESTFQTDVINSQGRLEDQPFTTPWTGFWEKDLYNPEWLFYVEVAAFVGILYIVIFIRPTRFGKNKYKGKADQPGSRSSGAIGRQQYGKNRPGRRRGQYSRPQTRKR